MRDATSLKETIQKLYLRKKICKSDRAKGSRRVGFSALFVWAKKLLHVTEASLQRPAIAHFTEKVQSLGLEKRFFLKLDLK